MESYDLISCEQRILLRPRGHFTGQWGNYNTSLNVGLSEEYDDDEIHSLRWMSEQTMKVRIQNNT